MRVQKNATINKLVKETKKAATNFQILPGSTVIDVVANTPDGKTYIFEMTIDQWQRMNKKPGVKYSSYQKGFASYPDAIRTEYKQ